MKKFWARSRGGFLLLLLLGLSLGGLTRSALAQSTQCVSTAVAGGTADALTVPALPCGVTTTLLVLKLSATNLTTTPTLQMLGGGTAQQILFASGVAVTAGVLVNGQTILLTNTGTNWVVLSALPGNSVANFTSPANQYLTAYGGGGFVASALNAPGASVLGGVNSGVIGAGQGFIGFSTAGAPQFETFGVINRFPANAAGITSLTMVMAGFGVAATPCQLVIPSNGAGVAQFHIEGNISNNTVGDGYGFRLLMADNASIAAPANNAAVVGTAVTQLYTGFAPPTAQGQQYSVTGWQTGLTPGHTYWFDLGEQAVTGGTVTAAQTTCGGMAW